MNILAIDTSTAIAAIALAMGDRIVAESQFLSERTLSARLIHEIDRILGIGGITADQVDLFAGAVGPGSFTGVRAGLATLQGLATAGGKPCAGFSSLTMLAMNFSLASLPVCSLLDARKGEVYGALYDCSGPIPEAIVPACVLSPEPFLDQLSSRTDAPVLFAGEGALRYRELISARLGDRALFPPRSAHTARAANGIILAQDALRRGELVRPEQLLPVYIRASEAEYAKLDRQNTRISRSIYSK